MFISNLKFTILFSIQQISFIVIINLLVFFSFKFSMKPSDKYNLSYSHNTSYFFFVVVFVNNITLCVTQVSIRIMLIDSICICSLFILTVVRVSSNWRAKYCCFIKTTRVVCSSILFRLLGKIMDFSEFFVWIDAENDETQLFVTFRTAVILIYSSLMFMRLQFFSGFGAMKQANTFIWWNWICCQTWNMRAMRREKIPLAKTWFARWPLFSAHSRNVLPQK